MAVRQRLSARMRVAVRSSDGVTARVAGARMALAALNGKFADLDFRPCSSDSHVFSQRRTVLDPAGSSSE